MCIRDSEKEALIQRMVAIVQRDAPWMFGYFPMSGGAYQQWVGNAKPCLLYTSRCV